MTKRLQAIEDRAKALGWDVKECERIALLIAGLGKQDDDEINLDDLCLAAERLLALYEPGATVTVKQCERDYTSPPITVMKCAHDCIFWGGRAYGDAGSTFSPEPYAKFIGCRLKAAVGLHSDEPGPLCPGPGTYKLVPVEVPDVD